jgi:hypothetical protein
VASVKNDAKKRLYFIEKVVKDIPVKAIKNYAFHKQLLE